MVVAAKLVLLLTAFAALVGFKHVGMRSALKGFLPKKEVDTKDCFFDKECHDKVDWTKIEALKTGIFARLKMWREQQDKNAVRIMIPKVHKMFSDAGMPDDRIDYILFKWVKSVYPDALEGMPKPEKANAWPLCAMAKTRCMVDGKKVLEGRCGDLWEKCGSELKTNAEKKVAFMQKPEQANVWPMCTMAKTRCMVDGNKMVKGRCGALWEKCASEWKANEGTVNEPVQMTGQIEASAMCMMAKNRCMDDGKKVLTGRCGDLWEKCDFEWKANEGMQKLEKRQHVQWKRRLMQKPETANAWPTCTMAKTQCMEDGKKVLKGRCGGLWEKCGSELKAIEGSADKKDEVVQKPQQATAWPMCTMAKTQCMEDGKKVLKGRCGDLWDKCGSEWKTNEVSAEKWPMCSMAKAQCMEVGKKVLKGRCGHLWQKCAFEWKINEGTAEKKDEDMQKPDQTDAWPMCTMAKTRCMEDGKKVLKGRCADLWDKCGSEWKANEGTADKKDEGMKKPDQVMFAKSV